MLGLLIPLLLLAPDPRQLPSRLQQLPGVRRGRSSRTRAPVSLALPVEEDTASTGPADSAAVGGILPARRIAGQVGALWEGLVAEYSRQTRSLAEALPERPRALLQQFLGTSQLRTGSLTAEEVDMERYFDELEAARRMAEAIMPDPGWVEVHQKDGVTVWKKWLPKGVYGSQYPCVKATAVVEVNAEAFVDLILDSSRVLEYNRYSRGRDDVARLGPHTKIVWNRTQPPLTGKVHDFCTLMHVDRRDGGGATVTTRATDHERAPRLRGAVRSEIVLGVTVVEPLAPGRATVTTVNHIVSAGIPAMIADRVSTKNAVDFISSVAAVAARGGGGSGAPAVLAAADV